MFFPLGSTYTYQVTCELFEFSSQKVNTGIEDIDDINDFSEDLFQWGITNEEGISFMTEGGDVITVEGYDPEKIMNMDDDADIKQRADEILDFTETNPYGTPT